MSRAWFDRLKQALLGWGFKNSKVGISFFIYRSRDCLILLFVYVDDILVTNNAPKLIAKLLQDLNYMFALKELGSIHYFLGI